MIDGAVPDPRLEAAVSYWESRLADPAFRTHLTEGVFPSALATYLDPFRGTYDVLDVNPGAVSSLGPKLAGKTLSLVVADPRAAAYLDLLRRLGISYAAELVAAAPEALADRLGEDRFDLVMYDNALDLCDDPAEAMRQMMRVLRPGAWACVAGTCNVARMEAYGGARLWNIDVREGRLVAWNRTDEHDLQAVLPDLAEADISTSEAGGNSFFRAWLRRRPVLARCSPGARRRHRWRWTTRRSRRSGATRMDDSARSSATR
jgi:SAM-dependent methyltransferase